MDPGRRGPDNHPVTPLVPLPADLFATPRTRWGKR